MDGEMISRLPRLITYLARPSFLGDNVFIDATHKCPGSGSLGLTSASAPAPATLPPKPYSAAAARDPEMEGKKTIFGFFS